MKKLFVIALALALVVGACTGKKQEAAKPNKDNLKVGFIYIGAGPRQRPPRAGSEGRKMRLC